MLHGPFALSFLSFAMNDLIFTVIWACRPDNGRTCERTKLDNRRVVPHNPRLLLKYQCHINVEVVASICAIKYVYKYVFKGPDRTMAKLSALPIPKDAAEAEPQAGGSQTPATDEITEYQDAR